MMNRNARLGRLGLVTLAVILATIVFGWAGPIFAGLIFAVVDARDSAPGEVALSAALAWTVILLFTVLTAGTGPARVIGASLGIPSIVLPAVSILFAAGLGWSAAALALAVRQALGGRRESTSLADPSSR